MSVFTKVLRAGEGKKVRRLAELVPLIGALEPEMQGLSDDALAHKTVEFKERLDQGETLDDLLIEAYAVVREAAWRVLGQRRLFHVHPAQRRAFLDLLDGTGSDIAAAPRGVSTPIGLTATLRRLQQVLGGAIAIPRAGK